MCSSNELYEKGREELDMEAWRRTIVQLRELGCTHFDLTGGEPTLKSLGWLCSLIEFINRKGDCIVSLATNGTLVTEDWLKELKAAGLNSILLDIQPGDHDKIVGHHGSYRKVSEVAEKALNVGLNVCINTCLGLHNKYDFERLLRVSQKKNLHVLTNLAAPTGRMKGKDVRITGFQKFYYDLMDKYPLMRSDTTYNYFGNNRCPGGREKIYITAYGEVIQCTFVQVSYGNVQEEPLKNIYNRMWENPLVRKKYICKHTFDHEFRMWIDVSTVGKKLPVRWR